MPQAPLSFVRVSNSAYQYVLRVLAGRRAGGPLRARNRALREGEGGTPLWLAPAVPSSRSSVPPLPAETGWVVLTP